MNPIRPRPGKPEPVSLRLPLIVTLLIIWGAFANPLFAQGDSLEISVVPISEIATTAAEDLQNTRDMLVHRIQVTTIADLVPQIDSMENQVSVLTDLSDQILGSQVDYSYYNSLILRWERINSRIDPMQEALKKYSAEVQGTRSGLEAIRSKWALTLQETDPAVLTEGIVARISGISHYLDSTRQILGDSLKSSIALQNRVTDLDLDIESYIRTITELRKVEMGKSLLTKDEPIFSITGISDSLHVKGNKALFLNMGIEDSRDYLDNVWPTLLLLLIAFFVLLIAFSILKKRHVSAGAGEGPEERIREIVVSKPVATAFAFTMLLAIWWLPPRPALMKEIFAILFILPFFPIFKDIVFKAVRFSLYYLFAILLFNILNDYLQLGVVYMRISSLLESLALFSFHIYFMIARKRLSGDMVQGRFFYQLLNTIQPFYFLLTLSAIVANVIGYRNFTDLVNEAVLMSLLLLMIFATGFFSLVSLTYLFFKTKSADKSLIIKEEKERIYKWLFRNLRIGTVFLWSFYTLKFFYLWIPLTSAVNTVLDLGYKTENLTITIRDFLSFILVVYVSWLLSVVIRNLLEIELFGRLRMPRGVPKAVSSLTQYFLVSAGFLLALSAAGFSMQNLSLLAGALGVGIGFGLQNIVNNIISGLILAFERPVTVGDIINVTGNEGVVLKIGIRASVIEQYDGSRVIVPNAELISNKVVNWTLSKYTRRSILTVHTHLETDTDQVLSLMKEAANRVKYVLKAPVAKSYFHGINDKEMEFVLYFWTSEKLLDCRSMVNQEVQKALAEAKINFVMPLQVQMQQEDPPAGPASSKP